MDFGSGLLLVIVGEIMILPAHTWTDMSVAAATREAVRDRPALFDALRAGVVNYTAAADTLDVDGDREAIATALRRFAAELADAESTADETPESTERSITVRLHSDIASQECPDALLAVGGQGISQPASAPAAAEATEAAVDTDGQTALRVTGDVDARLLAAALDRLRIAEIPVAATGLAAETMVVVVPRRAGPTAVQLIEAVATSN
jgi:hypothetical protein